MGFSLVEMQPVPCRFCGALDGDGHLFWECTFPLLLRFVKFLSFMISWEWIRDTGHGVCFGKVDFLSCLVLTVPLLGLLVLLRVLVTLLRVRLGVLLLWYDC